MVRGAFHHALIIPATFLNEHPKADNTKVKIRRDNLYDSEDLARHMANYVVNQIPTLSVTHIPSSDIIATDIWSDPFRVYACLFAKASRVLFLVTQHDVAAFGKFTKGRLQPLLNQSTPKDYDWKSRFLVLAMGDFELPASLPCEVIRFREVGWFRDTMALFVLGKKIQEFWTPKQEFPCLVANAEKLKFATNLEETETFQTLLSVKNLNNEEPAETRGDSHENFNTKFAHRDGLISNDGLNHTARQNFNVRFDIVSNRSLEIHELLLPNISVCGLTGTNKPLQANAHHCTAQSDIGLIGSSSDMDDRSPASGDVNSVGDSVGEMQWSSPDSVSVLREAEVSSALSPNEDGLMLATKEGGRLGSDSLQPNETEKVHAAARNAEITLTSELPKPTKRTRIADSQVMNWSLDPSSVRKQTTFLTEEGDAPLPVSEKDYHTFINVNASTDGPLEAKTQHSMESDKSLCSPESCDFVIQSKLGVIRSEAQPCSDELKNLPTDSKNTSPSGHSKMAKEDTIASLSISGDQKCTSLMGSQCFGEQGELPTDIGSTQSHFTSLPCLRQSISKKGGGEDKVKDRKDKPNLRPQKQEPDKLTPTSVTSSDELPLRTRLAMSDEELLYSTKGETLLFNRPKEVSHYRSNEIRRSRTPDTHGDGYGIPQSSQNSNDGSEVTKMTKACDPNGLKTIHVECPSTSPVQRKPMPQLTDFRTDNITTITETADGYLSDTYMERIKPRPIDILDGNLKAIHHDKKGDSSFESSTLLSQRELDKHLPKNQSARKLNLSLTANKTRNGISNSIIIDAEENAEGKINGKNSFNSSTGAAIVGSLDSLSGGAASTLKSPAINEVPSGNNLLKSTVVLRAKKTTLTGSDFPSISGKSLPPHAELKSPNESIKYFDVEGNSQVDNGVDLNASNSLNLRQKSPSMPLIKSLRREEVVSTCNSMLFDGNKNRDYFEDLGHARSGTDENRNVPLNTSRSVPLNENALRLDLLAVKKVEGGCSDASQSSLFHKTTAENQLKERQDSVQESTQRITPADTFGNEVNLSRIRHTYPSTKTKTYDPSSEICSELSQNYDGKSIKSGEVHYRKSPRRVYFMDSLNDAASNELREHTISHSVGIQDIADDNGSVYGDDNPPEDPAETVPTLLNHLNIPVHKAHGHIKTAVPLYAPASQRQSMLVNREPGLWHTNDLVEHGSWKNDKTKNDKTKNTDASKKVNIGEQSGIRTQEAGEEMQASMNTLRSRSESLHVLAQKGKKWKFKHQKSPLDQDYTETGNPNGSNESFEGQCSLNKEATTPTTNCISPEDTSYGVKWTPQDLPTPSPKCYSPFPDSDCDPEITSSTMSRPSCLLPVDKYPRPKILPRARIIQADQPKSSILRGGLKNLDAETLKLEATNGCQRLEAHESESGRRFSSISVNDEANQQEFEVSDMAVCSSYSELKVPRRPDISSVRLLHEIGEYQRNLSTQVKSGGKEHEIEAHGPYFRLIQEDLENDEGPSTYWCDRSVGSPTPYELSIRSDLTSDSSAISAMSRASSKDSEFTTVSGGGTVNALFSVYKALQKASKLLSSSNKIIMKQIEQLKSEQQ